MITYVYWLNKRHLKIKFMLKYLSSFEYINGLFRNKNSNRWSSPCTSLIFIANFIKGKFGIKTEEVKDTKVKEETVKIIEVKDTVVKEGKAEAIKEISSKLDSIEKKADKLYEKVKKKKKDKKKKKKNN